jgi:hypothetical protein
VRRVDRLAVARDWDGVLELRDACLAATEETGRQLWGPARFAAYRTALDAPAPLAAAMLEPGVVRFGLGPLTEVAAQRHTFAELAPHVDAALLPVVAQERVLRGEDLTGDPRAHGEPDAPPLRLQAFEPAYALPTYRADERLDGAFALPEADWTPLDVPTPSRGAGDTHVPAYVPAHVPVRLARALEEVVAPWAAQSSGTVRVVTGANVEDATHAVLATLDRATSMKVTYRSLAVDELLGLLAFAGASGGVHGRRRGGAAGRAAAWWVARCATGLDGVEADGHDAVALADELEFRLEDLVRLALRVPGEAAWRLELVLGTWAGAVTGLGSVADERSTGSAAEWGAAIVAFDREDATSVTDTTTTDTTTTDTTTTDTTGDARSSR